MGFALVAWPPHEQLPSMVEAPQLTRLECYSASCFQSMLPFTEVRLLVPNWCRMVAVESCLSTSVLLLSALWGRGHTRAGLMKIGLVDKLSMTRDKFVYTGDLVWV